MDFIASIVRQSAFSSLDWKRCNDPGDGFTITSVTMRDGENLAIGLVGYMGRANMIPSPAREPDAHRKVANHAANDDTSRI